MNEDLDKPVNPIKKALEAITHLSERINEFIEANPGLLNSLDDYFKNWPKYYKDDWVKLAEFGWYLNWETPSNYNVALEKGQTDLNAFMTSYLNVDWGKITNKILSLYPEREHILETAFRLHRDKNYIASIPLFFSQIDGICAQEVNAFLFTEYDQLKSQIQKIIDKSDNVLSDVLLEVLSSKTQFGASISKVNKGKKERAPNRSGILHGSRKHLDYGSEINSLKAFSLLAFIAFCFDKHKDIP